MNETKNSINEIIKNFVKKYENKNLLSFAYVGYTDHYEEKLLNVYNIYNAEGKWDPNYPVKICDFTNGKNCYDFM